MVQRKSKETKKPAAKDFKITQADFVLDYLIEKGKKGATNFEMMTTLHICDVRKRISELNNDGLLDYTIESVFEENKDGIRYKRYWAVPVDYHGDLMRFLDEREHISKPAKKRTGGGRR